MNSNPDKISVDFPNCIKKEFPEHFDVCWDVINQLTEIVKNINLDYLEKNDGILLTHTGPLPPPSRPKFADPMLLSDIGVDFPKLKVITAHMGLINWRPWASLAAYQPNLYGDLAMWNHFAYGKFDLFCRELRDLIDYVGVEKILFGSDGPIYDVVLPVKDYIEILKSLPKKAPKGTKFTNDEINAILGDNAAKLLGLQENL